jgi:enoyl-CoA hydratase
MSFVRTERRDGGIAIITIDRPKVNALNRAVLADLRAAFDEAEAGDGLRAIVLHGAGDKAFVAGADIAEMQAMSVLEAEAFSAAGQAALDRVSACKVPVIAAIQGFALGGGCELAMACDVVIAGPKAVFGQPEVKLGVIPGFGGTQRLVRRVGMAKAMDLCLTGRTVEAQEALAMGLVSRVTDGDPLAVALSVAAEIAGMGPVAIRLCKRALLENADSDLRAAQAAERTLFAACFATGDQKEGMSAFVERRAAQFTGA